MTVYYVVLKCELSIKSRLHIQIWPEKRWTRMKQNTYFMNKILATFFAPKSYA